MKEERENERWKYFICGHPEMSERHSERERERWQRSKRH